VLNVLAICLLRNAAVAPNLSLVLEEPSSSRLKTVTGTATASSATAAMRRWLAKAFSLMVLTSCVLLVVVHKSLATSDQNI